MNLIKAIGVQFSNPHGLAGSVSTFLMNQINQVQYRSIEDVFPDNATKILDIGFGNGYLLHRLAKQFPGEYYGVEISQDMLRVASQRNQGFIQSKQMQLQEGNVLNLPYEDKFFDFIYTVNTIYFWDNPTKGYQEIHRVLKEEGIFANTFYEKEWLRKIRYTKYGFQHYEPADIIQIAKVAGFRKVKVRKPRGEHSYCIVVKK